MDIISNKIFLQHETGAHPESKKRLEVFAGLPETEIENGEPYLGLVHTPEYISYVKQFVREGGRLDPDTVVSTGSYIAAVYAVGAAVMASEQGGFALVRPPGHHAHPDRAGGFCVFNNIAVAAANLVKTRNKRVMIFDFDGHLGDGTERIFYHSDKVLYWSLRQFPAYPYSGTWDDIGAGPGKGYTMNVCLPAGSGDDIFFKAIDELMPVAEQFKLDVVGVSAGFDARHSDPLLDLRLSAGAFYRVGQVLNQRFHNVFAVLEGGYNLEFLPRCLHNFVGGVNRRPVDFKEAPTESASKIFDEFEPRLEALKMNLSAYWKF
jgi:acetoin utilization deacetylase AcuC-like enzyme